MNAAMAAPVTICAARTSSLETAPNRLIAPHLAQNTNTWIGAHSPVVTGDFVWSNGEPWGYTHWLAGKPDNGAGSEDCVTANPNGFWDDAQCGNHRAFLCERAPAGMLP